MAFYLMGRSDPLMLITKSQIPIRDNSSNCSRWARTKGSCQLKNISSNEKSHKGGDSTPLFESFESVRTFFLTHIFGLKPNLETKILKLLYIICIFLLYCTYLKGSPWCCPGSRNKKVSYFFKGSRKKNVPFLMTVQLRVRGGGALAIKKKKLRFLGAFFLFTLRKEFFCGFPNSPNQDLNVY